MAHLPTLLLVRMMLLSTQQQSPFYYSHYAGQSASAGTSSFKLEDFVGAKFHCPHALADGNQRTQIREKTLEFSATVLSALSPNLGDKCLPST